MPLPSFDTPPQQASANTGGLLSDAKDFLSRVGLNLPNTPADIANATMKNINAAIQPEENKANVNYSIPVQQLPQATSRAQQFADVGMQGLVPAIAQFAVGLPIAEAALPEAVTTGGVMLNQALAQGLVSAATSASEGKDEAMKQGLIGAGLGLTSAIPRLARLPLNAGILGAAAAQQVSQGADPVMAYGQAGGMLFGSMLPSAIKPEGKIASLQKPTEGGEPPNSGNIPPSGPQPLGPRFDADGNLIPADKTRAITLADLNQMPFREQPIVDQSGFVHTDNVFSDYPNHAPNALDLLNNQLRNQEQWQENGALAQQQRGADINPVRVSDLNPDAVNLGDPYGAAHVDMHQAAQQHDTVYNGLQDYGNGNRFHLFTDTHNGSTFGVPEGSDGIGLRQQLADNRLRFASLQTPEDLVLKLRDVYSSLSEHPAVPNDAKIEAAQNVTWLDSLTKDGAKLSPDDIGQLNTLLANTHSLMKSMGDFYDSASLEHPEFGLKNPFEAQRAALRDVGGVEIPEHPAIPATQTASGKIYTSMEGHGAALDKASKAEPGLTMDQTRDGFLTDRGRFVNREEAYQLSQKANQTPQNREKVGLTSEDIIDYNKPESANSQEAPLPKRPDLKNPTLKSGLKLKANSNMSGAIQLRTGVALGGATAGALIGYKESDGDWKTALGYALLGAGAGAVGTGVLERLMASSPEALKTKNVDPIKALPQEESASLQKAGITNGARQSVILNLAFQDVTGRGSVLAKAARVLVQQFGFGTPEDLKTLKMLSQFPIDDQSRIVKAAQEKLGAVDAPQEIKDRAYAYCKGRLVPQAQVLQTISEGGGLSADDPFWHGASKETKQKLDATWQVGAPNDPNPTWYHVSSETRQKLVSMENDALFAGLQNQSDIDYAKWAQTARFAFNTMQGYVVEAFGHDTKLATQFINSMDQHVTRGFRFFADPKYMPTDEQVTAMAKETGMETQQGLIDKGLANSTVYRMEDSSTETPIVKDGVQVGTDKQVTSGYNSLWKRYSDNENYDLLGRLRDLVPLEHGDETYMVHPDVAEAYKTAGDLDNNRGIVEQYLYESRNPNESGKPSDVSGMDTTLLKSRKDIGPAWRAGLGEFTDPHEMMNYAISRIAPMAKAANFISEASKRDIHGLPGILEPNDWVKLKNDLQSQLADAHQAGDKKAFASLQTKLNELQSYKQGIHDIKFGLLKDHRVNPFLDRKSVV